MTMMVGGYGGGERYGRNEGDKRRKKRKRNLWEGKAHKDTKRTHTIDDLRDCGLCLFASKSAYEKIREKIGDRKAGVWRRKCGLRREWG